MYLIRRYNSNLLLEIFDDLERILASSENFLLGKWLNDAKALATSPEEESRYEYNARNQITLWGPRGEIRDYANKQWSGVIVDYFRPRWDLFLQLLIKAVDVDKPINETEANRLMFYNVEKPFSLATKIYPVEPQGIFNFQLSFPTVTLWDADETLLHLNLLEKLCLHSICSSFPHN